MSVPVLGQLHLFPREANEFNSIPISQEFVFTEAFQSIPSGALVIGLNGNFQEKNDCFSVFSMKVHHF